MSKYELSIAPDYCPSWTVVDAVRELFQNAIDQEVVTPGNDMFYRYDSHIELLTIGNRKSVLEIKSLLLGGSTKADDDKTIGKFGEGYKIASLVLCRLGKSVKFYNYGKKETWTPRFVNSRRYGTQVLTFFVEKHIWHSVPDANLTISIYGITQDEWEAIKASNLHICDADEVIETKLGRILLDEDMAGKVFVNGLFVCKYSYLKGYDFYPSAIKLDRDRKLVSDLDLQWLSSRMWADVEASDTLVDLLKGDAADVKYLNNVTSKFSDEAYAAFIAEHGVNAVPVTYHFELAGVPKGRKAVLVGDSYAMLIKRCASYVSPLSGPSAVELLQAWFEEIEPKLTEDEITRFNKIKEDL